MGLMFQILDSIILDGDSLSIILQNLLNKMPIKIEIENDEELLRKYGLSTALFAMADYLLGEFIRIFGKLGGADQSLVNKILDSVTFGRRIELAKEFINDEKILNKLKKGLEDRNLLAHGVTASRGQEIILIKGKKVHPLSHTKLDSVIERARDLNAEIVSLIQTKAKLR